MKKVLITSRSFGQINNTPINVLTDAGCEYYLLGKNFSQEEFNRILPEYDALIAGVQPIPQEILAQSHNLKIICKHGAGLDNIDLEKCKELGIKVCNAPGTNANAVADLTFGLMLAVTRGIVSCVNAVRQGQWKTYMGEDVYDKHLGLVGFGNIARCVARRAIGFDMKVTAYDPFITEVPEEFVNHVNLVKDLDSLYQISDIISLHLPLNAETRNLVGREAIAKMKDGVYLINCARGGILNENDLYDALISGKIAGAGLDVLEHEPCRENEKLTTLENCLITPHTGMYSKEAINAVSLICAQNVAAYFENKPLQFEVV